MFKNRLIMYDIEKLNGRCKKEKIYADYPVDDPVIRAGHSGRGLISAMPGNVGTELRIIESIQVRNSFSKI